MLGVEAYRDLDLPRFLVRQSEDDDHTEKSQCKHQADGYFYQRLLHHDHETISDHGGRTGNQQIGLSPDPYDTP